MTVKKTPEFALAGSQRWLQVAATQTPQLLETSLRACGAIDKNEIVQWVSPLMAERFKELRDNAALERLEVLPLKKRKLTDFWPQRGPVWDALATTSTGGVLLAEAKAHIPEAASPPSKASQTSLEKIERALKEARRFYAPKATALWSGIFYQYANRLAHQYFLRQVNTVDSRLVFLDFINATDVGGPSTVCEWEGATRLIHAVLGLPPDLRQYGVYHAYIDVSTLKNAL